MSLDQADLWDHLLSCSCFGCDNLMFRMIYLKGHFWVFVSDFKLLTKWHRETYMPLFTLTNQNKKLSAAVFVLVFASKGFITNEQWYF